MLHHQVPETEALALQARRLGAAAASAFGAGFGGSVWALVPEADAKAFLERWAAAYGEAFPARAAAASFFATEAAPAAFAL
jgi:galactokinase